MFALLVVATTGAFFVAQRLKRAPPPVERVYYPAFVSPNGDGRKDTASFRFALRERQRARASVVSENGTPVRRLADERLPAGLTRIAWDGRTDAGAVAPDGRYRLRVELPSQGRALTAPRLITLDTRPPRPSLLRATPRVVVPGLPATHRRGRVRIRYTGPSDPAPEVRVFRTDRGAPREVARFAAPRFRQSAEWVPVVDGRPAPEGTYAFTVTVRDRAGNAGSAPAVPPTREAATSRTGVTVDALAVRGPLEPVRAGAVARFGLGPRSGAPRLRWSLTRYGAARPVARGKGGGTALALRVPARARTGLYVLRATTAGGARAAHPLVVRRPDRRSARRPLVVLPAITWQGRNPVDDDGDGFPDTLDSGPAVGLGRPFARAAPPGLARGAGPLLRLLDDERARYEITTDLALARGHGPRLGRRRGLLFPGDERWLPADVRAGLARWVRAGGRLASFGSDAFRRGVTVAPARLERATPPAPADAFGERLATLAAEPAPLTVFSDALGVLGRAAGAPFGSFGRIEYSAGLPPGARRLTAAGREPERPAFTAYALGDGIVVRAGTPEWSRAALEQADVAQATRAIWALVAE